MAACTADFTTSRQTARQACIAHLIPSHTFPARAARSVSRADTARARVQSASSARRGTATLGTLSPFSVLTRGYSIAQRADDGSLVRDAAELKKGDRLSVRFQSGQATCAVERVDKDGDAVDVKKPARTRTKASRKTPESNVGQISLL